MPDYPKWHNVAEHVPLALVQHEIDAIRARLDAAGIPQIHVCDKLTPCDGSGSERWPSNGWTEAGDGTNYPCLPNVEAITAHHTGDQSNTVPDVANGSKFQVGDKVNFVDGEGNPKGDLFTIKGFTEHDGKYFWTLDETAGEFAGPMLSLAPGSEVQHVKAVSE